MPQHVSSFGVRLRRRFPTGKQTLILAFALAIGVLVSFPSAVASVGSYRGTVLADSPEAYWRLQEPTGATTIADASGNGHTGTPANVSYGVASPITTDPADAAISLDGSGYFQTGAGANFKGANGFTTEAWVYPTATGWGTIASDRTSSGSGWWFGLYPTAQLEAVFPSRFSISGPSLPLNQWSYVAAVYDPNASMRVRLYINGAETSYSYRDSSTGTGLTDTGPVWVGKTPDGSQALHGRLDEVALYNKPLTAARLADHFSDATQTTPPTNTSLPVISGATTEGRMLGASTGSWANHATGYSYQWRRCDSSGANCVDISGATGPAYTLVLADIGSTVRVVVTASNAAGAASATSAASAVIVSRPPLAPYPSAVLNDGPEAYWRLQEGAGATTLNDASGNNHSGSPINLGYGLGSPLTGEADDTAISLDGSGDFQTGADANFKGANGFTTEAWVYPTATGWGTIASDRTSSATGWWFGIYTGSSQIEAVFPPRFSISGPSLSLNQWSYVAVVYDPAASTKVRLYINGAETSYSYRDSSTGTGLTDTGPVRIGQLPDGSQGWHGRLDEVALYNKPLTAGGVSAHYGAATAAAPPSAPTNTSLPPISGSPTEGQTLSSDHGGWTGSPTTYSYQWRRCNSAGANCSDISGAASQSYTLTAPDLGSTLRVFVTAANSSGTGTASSNPTASVAPAGPPVNTDPPSISGTTTNSWTLTAAHGNWTENPSYSWQWIRCDSGGLNCAAIVGATSATYVLTGDDVGRKLQAQVTGTNSVGTATASSQQTDSIADLDVVEAPSPSADPQPQRPYNGAHIIATRWGSTGDGGYQLQFERDNGAWYSAIFPCVNFSDWPWNTCGYDGESYDGMGGYYSFQKEVWDDFGPDAASAGDADPTDAVCGDRATGGGPTIQCYRRYWYAGDESPPAQGGSDENEMTFEAPVPVDNALAQVASDGKRPSQLVSDIATADGTLALTYVVRPDETDSEILDNYAAAMASVFDDLAAAGQDESAVFDPNPPVSRVVESVSGNANGPSPSIQPMGYPFPNPFKSPGAKCPDPWWPLYGRIDVRPSSHYRNGVRQRYIYQQFRWTYASLTHLQCDSTATYEPDVVFYNGGSKDHYLKRTHNLVTATNLPDSYVDTSFLDSSKTPTWTIGTSDADKLRPDVNYFTMMRDAPGAADTERVVPNGQVGIIAGTCPHSLAKWCAEPMDTQHLLDNNPRRVFEMTVPGSVTWSAPSSRQP